MYVQMYTRNLLLGFVALLFQLALRIECDQALV